MRSGNQTSERRRDAADGADATRLRRRKTRGDKHTSDRRRDAADGADAARLKEGRREAAARGRGAARLRGRRRVATAGSGRRSAADIAGAALRAAPLAPVRTDALRQTREEEMNARGRREVG